MLIIEGVAYIERGDVIQWRGNRFAQQIHRCFAPGHECDASSEWRDGIVGTVDADGHLIPDGS